MVCNGFGFGMGGEELGRREREGVKAGVRRLGWVLRKRLEVERPAAPESNELQSPYGHPYPATFLKTYFIRLSSITLQPLPINLIAIPSITNPIPLQFLPRAAF